MRYLDIGRHQIKDCLDPIHDEAVKTQCPDLGLILHYANSPLGRYNSRQGESRSVEVDPNDIQQIEAYKADLRDVFRQWDGQPAGDLRAWLNS
jgi:hypothetical protein